ncbi:MAG: FAD-dependent oxidoreductase, partial [Kiritimatiellae bacterium]|nr:FAD-dependent oxidoreductase [Kiritimatiellia bacterium]
MSKPKSPVSRRNFLKSCAGTATLAGISAIATHKKVFGADVSSRVEANTKKILSLKEKTSSIAWKGDLVIVGATLGGMSLAVIAARTGKKVLVIETGGVLGTEISAQWDERIPEGWFASELADIGRPQGGFSGGIFDPFVTTLALDRLADSAGISCMVCVTPVRPVCGNDGLLKGVEIVGKSGRQLVAAPVVVDASLGSQFSRHACGLATQVPVSVTRRMYLSGVSTNGLDKQIDIPERFGLLQNCIEVQPALWTNEVILGYSMRPSPAMTTDTSFAMETYHKGLSVMEYLRKKHPAFANALLVDVAHNWQKEFTPAESDLKALENTGLVPLTDRMKAISDKQWASQFINNACALTSRQPLPVEKSVNMPSADNQPAATDELHVAVEQDCEETTLPGVRAILHDQVDVVVAGYGTGGVFASLAAAEQGVSVTVLDPAGIPGGMGTAGKIHSYYHGVQAGMQKIIDRKLSVATAICGKAGGFHHVAKVETFLREMETNRIQVEVGYRVFGVLKTGKTVKAVLAASEDGYHVFPCKVAVDATGDGDLATAAGAQFALGREGDGFPQPYSYTPTLTRGGKLAHHNFDAGWVDPTDTLDYSRAHFIGRARLWEKGPFNDKNHYCSLASLLGLRESRFIKGPVTLTFADFMEGKTYPDTVCAMYAHYDNHAIDYAQESKWAWRHVVMFGLWRYLCKGEIPYRCLY